MICTPHSTPGRANQRGWVGGGMCLAHMTMHRSSGM